MKKILNSIMQNMGERKCYLCGARGDLVVHHALHGYANRKKSDQDALIVWLCPVPCHHDLHDKGLHDDKVKRDAQIAWMRVYRKDVDAFISRYGKSYLDALP